MELDIDDILAETDELLSKKSSNIQRVNERHSGSYDNRQVYVIDSRTYCSKKCADAGEKELAAKSDPSILDNPNWEVAMTWDSKISLEHWCKETDNSEFICDKCGATLVRKCHTVRGLMYATKAEWSTTFTTHTVYEGVEQHGCSSDYRMIYGDENKIEEELNKLFPPHAPDLVRWEARCYADGTVTYKIYRDYKYIGASIKQLLKYAKKFKRVIHDDKFKVGPVEPPFYYSYNYIVKYDERRHNKAKSEDKKGKFKTQAIYNLIGAISTSIQEAHFSQKVLKDDKYKWKSLPLCMSAGYRPTPEILITTAAAALQMMQATTKHRSKTYLNFYKYYKTAIKGYIANNNDLLARMFKKELRYTKGGENASLCQQGRQE